MQIEFYMCFPTLNNGKNINHAERVASGGHRKQRGWRKIEPSTDG